MRGLRITPLPASSCCLAAHSTCPEPLRSLPICFAEFGFRGEHRGPVGRLPWEPHELLRQPAPENREGRPLVVELSIIRPLADACIDPLADRRLLPKAASGAVMPGALNEICVNTG